VLRGNDLTILYHSLDWLLFQSFITALDVVQHVGGYSNNTGVDPPATIQTFFFKSSVITVLQAKLPPRHNRINGRNRHTHILFDGSPVLYLKAYENVSKKVERLKNLLRKP